MRRLALLGMPLFASCVVAACGSSGPSGCGGIGAGTDTVTGTLFTQARNLPASPLPDVIPDAVKLRVTVVQAQRQIGRASLRGQLHVKAMRLSRDLVKGKRDLDQFISGVRQNGVAGYRGPSAIAIESVLTDADHVADQISASCSRS